MKPTWIFNFLKKDSIESFFDTYWTAVNNANNSNKPKPRRFYITDCFSEQFNVDNVLENEVTRIVTSVDDKGPLIEGWIDNERSSNKKDIYLNLIFVGDITNKETQRSMLDLAYRLRTSLLNDQWANNASVQFYGLLLRPESARTKPISEESTSFLKKLETLMKEGINSRPFHKVLFFESSEKEKNDMIISMSLATLKLSTYSKYNENDIILRDENKLYLNAGCSSVFYEKEVINDQDAYLLSNSIYEKLINGIDDLFFYDPQEAQRIIDKNDPFLKSFSSKEIYKNIKYQCSPPPTEKDRYGAVCDIHPLRSKLKEVWNIYYNKYVVNLKKDLVNITKQTLFDFAEDYKEKLKMVRLSLVNSTISNIDRFVFSMFENPDEYEAISLPQAELILDKFRQKVENFSREFSEENNDNFSAFDLPASLKGAYEQAKSEHNCDEKSVLDVLDGKLRNHPIFLFSLFLRTAVLGAMLAYFGLLIFDNTIAQFAIGSLLFLIPIIVGMWRFKEHVDRIEALKDQYIACVLSRLNDELTKDLRSSIEVVYTDILEYCNWLKKNKLDYLKDNLFTFKPLEFSFKESKYFKPLLNNSYLPSTENQAITISPKLDRTEMLSEGGNNFSSFGKYPILDKVPTATVDNIPIKDIVIDTSNGYRARLLKELLKETISNKNIPEKDPVFYNKDIKDTKLLILDVSGSMEGKNMKDLKEAITKFAEKSRILWIAFNNDVVAQGEGAEEFSSIKAEGKTFYIPALNRAKVILENEIVNQVVFISDGAPFETTNDILDVAKSLNTPIHTVSIGNIPQDVMPSIANETRGSQIIVDDLKDIVKKVNDDFGIIYTFGNENEYTFGQLLRKCYIRGCDKIMHNYTKKKLVTVSYSINKLLSEYRNDNGFIDWVFISKPTCSYAPNKDINTKISILQLVDSDRNNDNLKTKLNKIDRVDLYVTSLDNLPDIEATILSLKPMDSIWDLQWAKSKDKKV